MYKTSKTLDLRWIVYTYGAILCYLPPNTSVFAINLWFYDLLEIPNEFTYLDVISGFRDNSKFKH